jgi:anti-sigma factor RsiW
MKDSRFIELLNLYVDQQLTAAEAVELEAELQHNPASRRTYQQYCRMQKACAQLFEQECQGAPSTSTLSRALAQADRKVVAFPEQRPQWRQRGVFAAGVAAMAACVALVFVRQGAAPAAGPVASSSAPAPMTVAVAAVEPTVSSVQTVSIPPADPQTKTLRSAYAVFPVRQFVPVQVVSANGETLGQAEEQADLNWMKNVELAPMRAVNADELTAESNSNLQQPARIYINNRRPVQEQYEKAAFSFQKGR